jgi:predicted DNA-binding protein (MmcQ/YjbR family)
MTETLLKFALKYPETERGIACEGTTAEKTTVKVGKKAFMFLRPKDLMIKLNTSIAEANSLALKEKGALKVGSNGWVTVMLDNKKLLPPSLLEKWIDESYRLIVLGDKSKTKEKAKEKDKSTKSKTTKSKSLSGSAVSR